jgi:hypothetical protein
MPIRNEVDMSPAAVTRRLEELRQLYRLAQYLKRFKIVDDKR